MTLSEFKAWFEGFTEDMEGPPSEKQWKKIKARVKDITGVATSYPVFVDRYVPQPYRPYWTSLSAVGSASGQATVENVKASYSGEDMMRALGKQDAELVK